MMITVLSALLAGAFSLCAQPQQSREWHRERYDRQVKNVGIAGVGVGVVVSPQAESRTQIERQRISNNSADSFFMYLPPMDREKYKGLKTENQ